MGLTSVTLVLTVTLLTESARAPLCPCSPHQIYEQILPGTKGDSRCAPGKGTSKAVPDFTGELGERGKAKQAGAQLFYKARASISALVLLNEAERLPESEETSHLTLKQV